MNTLLERNDMKTWNKFKNAYQQYFCESDKSLINIKDEYSLMCSGINNHFFNYMFVNGKDLKSLNPISSINFNMAIFSLEQSRPLMQSWSKETSVRFLSTGAIMTKDVQNNYNRKQIDNVKVVKINNDPKYIEDCVSVMSKVKKVSEKDIEKNMKKNDNIHIYLAYFNGRPAGILSAIIIENSAISVDSAIMDDIRGVGVLTALGEAAMMEGIERGITSYSSIVTSPYTMKLVERQGYKFEMPCDVWVYLNE